MSEDVLTVQNYHSLIGDIASRKYETFSYLPEMTAEEMKAQIQYIIDKEWDVAIEHVEPTRTKNTYWYMWKLPMFGEWNIDTVMEEIEACSKAYPNHHVKVIGYNKLKQSQGTAMVVRRASV